MNVGENVGEIKYGRENLYASIFICHTEQTTIQFIGRVGERLKICIVWHKGFAGRLGKFNEFGRHIFVTLYYSIGISHGNAMEIINTDWTFSQSSEIAGSETGSEKRKK